MLKCQNSEKEGDNCTHCQTASGDNRLYWGIQLDQDLLETIVGIYPEWFKDCSMNLSSSRPDVLEDVEKTSPTIIPLTADSKAQITAADVEALALQKAIERNKESLKSSSAFHEHRHKLERSKMGDILKSKIQKRPDRQALLQQFILGDSNMDSSLQEKQRLLKSTALLDGFSSPISRTGHLDLVKDEVLAQAVREGSLHFRNLGDESSSLMKVLQEDESGSDCASPSPPYNFSEHSQGSFPSLEASEPSPNPMLTGSPCSGRTSFSISPPSSVSSPLSIIQSVVSPQSQTDQVPELILNGLLMQSKESPAKNRKKAKPKTQPKARTIKFHEYKGPPNAPKNVQSSNAPSETSYDLLLQQQQLFLQWQLEWQQKYPQSVLPPSSAQMPNGDQLTQSSQSANPTSAPVVQSQPEPPPSPQKVITKLEDLKVSDLKAELKKRNLPVSGPKPILIERLKVYAETAQHAKSVNSANSNLNKPLASPSPVPSGSVNIGGILLDNLSSIPTSSSDVDMSSFDLNAVQNADLTSDIYENLDNDNQPSIPSQDNGSLAIELDQPMCTDAANDVSEASILTNEAIVEFQQRCIQKLQMELQKSQMQLQQSIISQHRPSQEATTIEEVTKISSPPAVQESLLSQPPSSKIVISSVPSSCSSTPSRSTPTVVTVQSMELKDKLRQRQLIHQQLQQKIHQQSLLIKNQNKPKEPENGKPASVPKQPSSTPSSSSSSESALTALLKSEPMNSPVEINLPSVSDTDEEAAQSISTLPSLTNAQQADETDFPGTLPLFMNSAPTSATSSSAVPSSRKSSSGNMPAHRTSSLPSFSALVNNKPTPTRSNTDPLFLINRPPPNYNEATRQLNKMKQQLLQTNVEYDNDSRQAKKLKSSVKCQAVDDVLEILIKNGELPPSAAHEPQTPVSLGPKRKVSSPPSYQTQNTSSSIAITLSTNSITSPIISSATPTSSDGDANLNLHMSSLQSVLDMTPPSSAGFGEPNNNAPSSLDFDFHLDVMEDLDVMDLDALPRNEPIQTLPTNLPKTSRNATRHSHNHINGNHELLDYQSRGMDADIIEWLELLGENTSNGGHHLNYNIQNEHDPMLSNLGNCQESLDLFGVDDMDFKTNEISILSWDKADFAT